MKTIKAWFNTLPEPYKNQALENMRIITAKEKVSTLRDAIESGFVWVDSAQGEKYWRNFNNSLLK